MTSSVIGAVIVVLAVTPAGWQAASDVPTERQCWNSPDGVGCSRSVRPSASQSITRVLQTPGRFPQSLAESSFDAWTKFYKQDENSPNTIISYYVKGALVALALDLTIPQSTKGG